MNHMAVLVQLGMGVPDGLFKLYRNLCLFLFTVANTFTGHGPRPQRAKM